ncbi:Hypothetical_protein [Hexamita inflata]|uniref:Hypothetical_protein n=1 Tax=Hexamita inflata TaxID=28002 RepID=A0AA86QF50_9EUKA|nr:Hypothetical protein HINF_LOCUS21872 [Hexamita inflata]CAI9950625.1 Hypothetical protein HINF_LOCUS38270 [Hexamita inflata]CAI9951992.1 Hypothetical protein HINF_LOCUS39637 [Hexamita inflata]
MRKWKRFEQFDHTTACYITDYILSANIFICSAVLAVTKRKLKYKKEMVIKLLSSIGCLILSLYSLLAAIVHHKFVNNDRYKLFSNLWFASEMFGFVGFGLLFMVYCFVYFPINYVFVFVSAVLTIGMASIPWIIGECLFILTPLTILDIIMLVISLTLTWIKTKDSTKRKNLKIVVILQLLSISLMIFGVIAQLTQFNEQSAFNHNAIYHLLFSVGFPLHILTLILCIDYPDQNVQSMITAQDQLYP